jgi:integrase
MMATRKPRSRGRIEARGAGKWLVRLSMGFDPVAKKRVRLNVTVTGTRKEAEQKLTELLGKHDTGAPLPRSRHTLAEWLDEFATVWSGELAASTQHKAASCLRTYVPGWLLGAKLRDLTPRTFQQLYNELGASGKSPATISYLHRVLRSRLQKAVAEGHLAHNPLAVARPPVKEHREYRTLTPEQARHFLAVVESDRYGALWTLLLTSGLRPGEALGLKWEDLEDQPSALLRVRRALVRLGKDGWTIEGTKTRKPRSIPLATVTLRLLQKHRARQAQARLLLGGEYAPHGFIFASTFGEPLQWGTVTARHFRPLVQRLALRILGEGETPAVAAGMTRTERRTTLRAFVSRGKEAIRLAGLAGLRPYDLRHSAATLLLASGEHPKIVAELLGHSKIALTLDTYSHVIPGLTDRAANRLEQIITDGKQDAQRGA